MASNIDPTQPPALNPTTAAMRANMAAAKAEIEALQALARAYPAPLSGYVMVSPGIYMVSGAVCTVTSGYDGTSDNVKRNQNVLSMVASDAPLPPAGCTRILIKVYIEILAAGVPGMHEFNCLHYADSAGSLLASNPAIYAMERAGDTAGEWIGAGQPHIWIPVTNPSTVEITTKYFDSHNNNPTYSQAQSLQILGYMMNPL